MVAEGFADGNTFLSKRKGNEKYGIYYNSKQNKYYGYKDYEFMEGADGFVNGNYGYHFINENSLEKMCLAGYLNKRDNTLFIVNIPTLDVADWDAYNRLREYLYESHGGNWWEYDMDDYYSQYIVGSTNKLYTEIYWSQRLSYTRQGNKVIVSDGPIISIESDGTLWRDGLSLPHMKVEPIK